MPRLLECKSVSLRQFKLPIERGAGDTAFIAVQIITSSQSDCIEVYDTVARGACNMYVKRCSSFLAWMRNSKLLFSQLSLACSRNHITSNSKKSCNSSFLHPLWHVAVTAFLLRGI